MLRFFKIFDRTIMFNKNFLLTPLVIMFSFGFMFSEKSNAFLNDRSIEDIQVTIEDQYTENLIQDLAVSSKPPLIQKKSQAKTPTQKKPKIEPKPIAKITPVIKPKIPAKTTIKAKPINKPKKKIAKSVKKQSKKAWLPKSTQLKQVYLKILAKDVIPVKALRNAFKFYQRNQKRNGLSKDYITVADYTKTSNKNRLHLINLKNGTISSYYVAHGKKSGPMGGRVIHTSNKVGSNMTSKGFFKVGFREGVTLSKKHKYLSVQGLEKANRKVGWPTRLGGRDVIVHTAKYAEIDGRSEGCFAIKPKDKKAIFSKIKGSLFYSFAG